MREIKRRIFFSLDTFKGENRSWHYILLTTDTEWGVVTENDRFAILFNYAEDKIYSHLPTEVVEQEILYNFAEEPPSLFLGNYV